MFFWVRKIYKRCFFLFKKCLHSVKDMESASGLLQKDDRVRIVGSTPCTVIVKILPAQTPIEVAENAMIAKELVQAHHAVEVAEKIIEASPNRQHAYVRLLH